MGWEGRIKTFLSILQFLESSNIIILEFWRSTPKNTQRLLLILCSESLLAGSGILGIKPGSVVYKENALPTELQLQPTIYWDIFASILRASILLDFKNQHSRVKWERCLLISQPCLSFADMTRSFFASEAKLASNCQALIRCEIVHRPTTALSTS